jgi:hypothetical protein
MILLELQLLDKEIYDLAVANCHNKDIAGIGRLREFDFLTELINCFAWYKSKQGHDFWNMVDQGKIKKARKLAENRSLL